MSASWLLTALVSALLLPPLNLVLLGIAGFALRHRWPRTGSIVCIGALIALIVFSTGAGARLIVEPLEKRSMPLQTPVRSNAQAIVVLGGGRIPQAPEYGGNDIPGSTALMRLRYAAKLQRETRLPILTTGGRPDGSAESEASLMARVLREDFSVPVRWLEQESDNTAQNALFSARMLKQEKIPRILLVTDAIHMPRAKQIFEHAGFEVIAAPTVFLSRSALTSIDFIPSGAGLELTHYAMHEWIGAFWYRLRYGIQ